MPHLPDGDEAENTSRAEVAWTVFVSFAKTVLRNESRTLWRKERNRQRINQTEYIHDFDQAETDYYVVYDNIIVVNRKEYTIHNEALFHCLKQLPNNWMEALVFRFWEKWTDIQIAAHFRVSERTIRNWRTKAIQRLEHDMKREKEHQ